MHGTRIKKYKYVHIYKWRICLFDIQNAFTKGKTDEAVNMLHCMIRTAGWKLKFEPQSSKNGIVGMMGNVKERREKTKWQWKSIKRERMRSEADVVVVRRNM